MKTTTDKLGSHNVQITSGALSCNVPKVTKRRSSPILPYRENLALWIALSLLGMITNSFAQYQFTTISAPLGVNGSFATGISGSNVVGYYIDANGTDHGFLFNGSGFTTLDAPLATGTDANGFSGTSANGISGSEVVGTFAGSDGNDHGFLFDGTTYTALDEPLATGSDAYGFSGTVINGISGNQVVGYFVGNDGKYRGFLYNGATFSTIDEPLGARGTYPYGISGSNIVGSYVDKTNHAHGFLFNGTKFTTINFSPTGVSGNNIVGYATVFGNAVDHLKGLFYQAGKLTSVADPLAQGTDSQGNSGTYAAGIFQGNIVGYYIDTSGDYNGFVATPVNWTQGRYTALLTSTDTLPEVPQGLGYATLTISKTGGVTLAGKLPDGESFSAASSLQSAGTSTSQFAVNKPLSYPKREKGSLTGELSVFAVTGSTNLSGTLTWNKPQEANGAYPAAFTTTLVVTGSPYSFTSGGSVLPGFVSGTLTLSDTNAVVLSGSAHLAAGDALSLYNPVDQLKVTLTPSTGIFKGAFSYPIAGKTAKRTAFSGVVLQSQNTAGGFYLGPNGSGMVSLTNP